MKFEDCGVILAEVRVYFLLFFSEVVLVFIFSWNKVIYGVSVIRL